MVPCLPFSANIEAQHALDCFHDRSDAVFCAVQVSAHYVRPNISRNARDRTSAFFKVLQGPFLDS